MKSNQLKFTQSPQERIAAERERNRRALEKVSYPTEKIPFVNATMSITAPWVLFKDSARHGAEDHRQHPSRIGDRRVYLDERKAGTA